MTAVLERLRLASAVIAGSAEAASIVPVRTFQISRGPLDLFVWPDEDSLDDWGKLEVRKLRREVEERYTRYHSFDICSLHKFLQNMRIRSLLPPRIHTIDCNDCIASVSVGCRHPSTSASRTGSTTSSPVARSHTRSLSQGP